MKSVKKAIALVAVIFGVSMSSFAQNGLSVRVGGNFPMGAFAEGGSLSDIALNNASSKLGGAATGLNAGLKYQFGLLGNLSVFASADLFYNGLKGDLKEDLLKLDDDAKLPTYMNIPVMAGVNYELLDIAGAALWVEAGLGVNFRNISSLESESNIFGSEIETGTSYKMATTFAWEAGVGVSVADKVSLGLHYYAFGSSAINGDPYVEDGGAIGNWADQFKDEFQSGKLNPSMIVIRLGYHF